MCIDIDFNQNYKKLAMQCVTRFQGNIVPPCSQSWWELLYTKFGEAIALSSCALYFRYFTSFRNQIASKSRQNFALFDPCKVYEKKGEISEAVLRVQPMIKPFNYF